MNKSQRNDPNINKEKIVPKFDSQIYSSPLAVEEEKKQAADEQVPNAEYRARPLDWLEIGHIKIRETQKELAIINKNKEIFSFLEEEFSIAAQNDNEVLRFLKMKIFQEVF